MENPILILKPSVINALVPVFLKKLFYFILILGFLLGGAWLLRYFDVIDPSTEDALIGLGILSLLFFLLPILFQFVFLYNTQYVFYETHVVSEFELMIVKRHTTPYHQIVNITSDVSIWDRLCNAGDLTMHTAEDRLPDLTLKFIKNPNEVEKKIYTLMQKQKEKPEVPLTSDLDNL